MGVSFYKEKLTGQVWGTSERRRSKMDKDSGRLFGQVC